MKKGVSRANLVAEQFFMISRVKLFFSVLSHKLKNSFIHHLLDLSSIARECTGSFLAHKFIIYCELATIEKFMQ
jgi:hypothetical protein